MRALLSAVGLFTVIPVRPFDVDRRAASRAMAALPVLGLLLGLAAGAVAGLLGWLTSPLLGAVVGLALLAWLTGALHLDGVADTADGLGSRKPADEALAIMRRSDIGPMGVVVLVFVLGLDVASLASLPTPALVVAALAGAVMVSRLAVTVATVSRTSARVSGFGALFVGVTSTATAVVNALVAALVVVALGWLGAGWRGAVALGAASLVAGIVARLWGSRLVRRLGGWTGDIFGSLIEVTQAAFLLSAAVAAGALF